MLTSLAALWAQLHAWILGGLAAALLAWAVVERIQLAAAHHDVAVLTDRIENKTTGYIAQLATCHGNVGRLEASVDDQNAAASAAATQAIATAAALDRAASDARSARAVAESRRQTIAALVVAGPQDCPAIDALIAGATQ